MRITGPGHSSTTGPRKTGKTGKSASDSSFANAVGDTEKAGSAAAPGASGMSGASPVTAVDALLSLQEAPGGAEGRSGGLGRARDMLDILENVRRGILLGAVPEAQLERLARLSRSRREEFTDPRLTEILDEIELRAEVELAKLQSGE